MVRLLSLLAIAVAAFAATGTTAAAPPPTPACPQVEGWTLSGQPMTIDSGLHLQFRCVYALPGHVELATFDAFW